MTLHIVGLEGLVHMKLHSTQTISLEHDLLLDVLPHRNWGGMGVG